MPAIPEHVDAAQLLFRAIRELEQRTQLSCVGVGFFDYWQLFGATPDDPIGVFLHTYGHPQFVQIEVVMVEPSVPRPITNQYARDMMLDTSFTKRMRIATVHKNVSEASLADVIGEVVVEIIALRKGIEFIQLDALHGRP